MRFGKEVIANTMEGRRTKELPVKASSKVVEGSLEM